MKEHDHPAPAVTDIQTVVCSHFNTNRAEMRSHRLDRATAFPRQIAMYLAYELTGLSNAEIGRVFGDRDHTTVIHARRVVPQRIERDQELATRVFAIRTEILARARTGRPCGCAACLERERRFPFDPAQLLLPVAWPDELPLGVAA